MTDWREVPITHPPLGPGGWLRVVLRGGVLGGVTYGALVLLLLVRLIEAPLFGLRRPLSPYVTQGVCRAAFAFLGMGVSVTGRPMSQDGAVVANHSSWLDIFALNAAQRVYFVAKSEVEGWAGIGWLARATGTVFIRRKGADAKVQQQLFEHRLQAGHRLLFFPEGTSTDGLRVLPFKSTLFAAFFAPALVHAMHIQPVSVIYHAPPGADPRLYGWWGEMEFASHLLHTLANRPQGRVEVVFHSPVKVDEFADRKALAAHCERTVRAAHALAAIPA
jgi:1-acyl-sn-glycerol-3-phosphate acyltransferase